MKLQDHSGLEGWKWVCGSGCGSGCGRGAVVVVMEVLVEVVMVDVVPAASGGFCT